MSTKKCMMCNGRGVTEGPNMGEYKECRTCGGTGVVIICSFCRGTGYYTPNGLFNSPKRCPHCDGKGYY